MNLTIYNLFRKVQTKDYDHLIFKILQKLVSKNESNNKGKYRFFRGKAAENF